MGKLTLWKKGAIKRKEEERADREEALRPVVNSWLLTHLRNQRLEDDWLIWLVLKHGQILNPMYANPPFQPQFWGNPYFFFCMIPRYFIIPWHLLYHRTFFILYVPWGQEPSLITYGCLVNESISYFLKKILYIGYIMFKIPKMESKKEK